MIIKRAPGGRSLETPDQDDLAPCDVTNPYTKLLIDSLKLAKLIYKIKS